MALILTGWFTIGAALFIGWCAFKADSYAQSYGDPFTDHSARFAIVAGTLGCLGIYLIRRGMKLKKKVIVTVIASG